MNSIAVIGAGPGGMAAAYDLCRAGKKVVIFEKEPTPGGLASGFKEDGWNWSLEKYYHHWFQSDSSMLGLIQELGFKEKLRFYRPKTVVYHEGDFYPLDSPLAALLFPGFSLIDKMRFGFVTIYLRYLASWKPLEKYTAHEWMLQYYGEKVYRTLFEPLLMGKFSSYYRDVNMAWFWARFKVRTPRLGTYEGGFQAFLDDFAEKLQQMGVEFRYNAQVERIEPRDGGKLVVTVGGSPMVLDQVLATLPPKVMVRFAPELSRLSRSTGCPQSLGAVVLIISLKRQLSERYYWFNLPKSAGFPFRPWWSIPTSRHLKTVANEHLIYCGDYLEPPRIFPTPRAAARSAFQPQISESDFEPSWVNRCWLFRTPLLRKWCRSSTIQKYPSNPNAHSRLVLCRHEPGLPRSWD